MPNEILSDSKKGGAANRSRSGLMDILRAPRAGPESDVFRRDLLFRRQESPDPQAGRKPVALI
jgi:hypothetical protein